MGRNSIFGNVIYCAVLVTDKNLLQNRPEQFKIRTFYLAQIDKYNLKRSTNPNVTREVIRYENFVVIIPV
jgi:hypothetical protein